MGWVIICLEVLKQSPWKQRLIKTSGIPGCFTHPLSKVLPEPLRKLVKVCLFLTIHSKCEGNFNLNLRLLRFLCSFSFLLNKAEKSDVKTLMLRRMLARDNTDKQTSGWAKRNSRHSSKTLKPAAVAEWVERLCSEREIPRLNPGILPLLSSACRECDRPSCHIHAYTVYTPIGGKGRCRTRRDLQDHRKQERVQVRSTLDLKPMRKDTRRPKQEQSVAPRNGPWSNKNF